MRKKLSNILIAIFWIAFFTYLATKGFTTVVIFSLILLGMTLAFATSNEI